jgi:branched-chain amino acid transport system ATP-binding protein
VEPAPAGGLHSLEVYGVSVNFDALVALRNVDLHVERNEILGLIGGNGAGKTTLVNVLTGYVRPSAGRVLLDGRDVTGFRTDRLARAGLARTFQGVRLFGRLSVAENVEAGAVGRGTSRRRARQQCTALLKHLELERWADVEARALPFGLERRVSIARALAGAPSFLLLDEPAAGLDDTETQDLAQIVREVPADFQCGLLLIDHDVSFILSTCHRIHVLAEGQTVAVGDPQAVVQDPRVIDAYLGVQDADAASLS